jgi:hypothetical protein
LVGYAEKHENAEEVTGSQDDDFVEVLKKNIPHKLALMGLCPGLARFRDSDVPAGLDDPVSFFGVGFGD